MHTYVQVFLLAGRKRKIGASANYAISMDETDFTKGESYLAKLRYAIYTILYDTIRYDTIYSIPGRMSLGHSLRSLITA